MGKAATAGGACCARAENPVISNDTAMAANARAVRILSGTRIHDLMLGEWTATVVAIPTFNSGRDEVMWLIIPGKEACHTSLSTIWKEWRPAACAENHFKAVSVRGFFIAARIAPEDEAQAQSGVQRYGTAE